MSSMTVVPLAVPTGVVFDTILAVCPPPPGDALHSSGRSRDRPPRGRVSRLHMRAAGAVLARRRPHRDRRARHVPAAVGPRAEAAYAAGRSTSSREPPARRGRIWSRSPWRPAASRTRPLSVARTFARRRHRGARRPAFGGSPAAAATARNRPRRQPARRRGVGVARRIAAAGRCHVTRLDIAYVDDSASAACEADGDVVASRRGAVIEWWLAELVGRCPRRCARCDGSVTLPVSSRSSRRPRSAGDRHAWPRAAAARPHRRRVTDADRRNPLRAADRPARPQPAMAAM